MNDNRVTVFIDASNLWQVIKSKGQTIDFVKLKKFMIDEFSASSVSIYYYTAYPKEGTRVYSTAKQHDFFAFLEKRVGFIVRKKPLKTIIAHTDNGDVPFEKGNMDVEITIDAVNNINSYDVAVFFCGDSDFLALVKFIRNKDKKVYVFSSKNNISKEMKTGSNGYTDLLEIDGIWRSSLTHRKR